MISSVSRWPAVFAFATACASLGPLNLAAADTFRSRLTVAGCSLPNMSLLEALAEVRALDFAGIEIATFADDAKAASGKVPDHYPWVVIDRLSPGEKARVKAAVQKFRHVSVHLPYGPTMRPIAPEGGVREASRRELRRALDDGAFLGARLANIHVLTETGLDFPTALPGLVQLYRELGDYAQARGMRLAIEITRPYTAAEYLRLVEAIGHPNVGGSIDTGHVHFFAELSAARKTRHEPDSVRAYNDLLVDLVRKLGPKLFHLHLDDLRRVDWREHFVPGTGIIDWPRFFRALESVDYSGLFVLELLYYVGADDTANLMRAFTQRTPEGAANRGLRTARDYLQGVVTVSANP
jgi:sugar phosphate isomerase/epimerase